MCSEICHMPCRPDSLLSRTVLWKRISLVRPSQLHTTPMLETSR